MKKEYVLKDNYSESIVTSGSFLGCLEYVRNYELLYCDDIGEKSVFTDDFDELIFNDDNIIELLQVCEFTILEKETLKPLIIKNINKMIDEYLRS